MPNAVQNSRVLVSFSRDKCVPFCLFSLLIIHVSSWNQNIPQLLPKCYWHIRYNQWMHHPCKSAWLVSCTSTRGLLMPKLGASLPFIYLTLRDSETWKHAIRTKKWISWSKSFSWFSDALCIHSFFCSIMLSLYSL